MKWMSYPQVIAFFMVLFAQVGSFSRLAIGSADDESVLVTVQGFAVHGYSGGKEIGYDWYPTQAEAEAAKARMLKVEVTNGKFYDRVEITNESRDLPRELVPPNVKLKPNMRPGDVLAEYKKRIEKAYENAVHARKTLVGGTSRIADEKFREVNNLIAGFNSQRDEYIQKSGGQSPGVPQVAPITPADVPGRLGSGGAEGEYEVWVFKKAGGQWVRQSDRTLSTDDIDRAEKYASDVNATPGWKATSNLDQKRAARLVGRHGKGTFMDGVTPLNVDFESGGVATFRSADEKLRGSWSVSGTRITMQVGASTLSGTIRGDRMSGGVSRTNASSNLDGKRLSDRQGSWDLTLQP